MTVPRETKREDEPTEKTVTPVTTALESERVLETAIDGEEQAIHRDHLAAPKPRQKAIGA